jgi:hypothetical protein
MTRLVATPNIFSKELLSCCSTNIRGVYAFERFDFFVYYCIYNTQKGFENPSFITNR